MPKIPILWNHLQVQQILRTFIFSSLYKRNHIQFLNRSTLHSHKHCSTGHWLDWEQKKSSLPVGWQPQEVSQPVSKYSVLLKQVHVGRAAVPHAFPFWPGSTIPAFKIFIHLILDGVLFLLPMPWQNRYYVARQRAHTPFGLKVDRQSRSRRLISRRRRRRRRDSFIILCYAVILLCESAHVVVTESGGGWIGWRGKR